MNHPVALLLQPWSIAPAAREWAVVSREARVLHAFDRSCNLINEHGRILSLVTAEIGDGPFNAVVPGMEYTGFDEGAVVELHGGSLWMYGYVVDLLSAPLWQPRPDWISIRASRALVKGKVLAFLSRLPDLLHLSQPASPVSAVCMQSQVNEVLGLAARDLSLAINRLDLAGIADAARHLAGLGEGLTPSGDDILIGALHAAWILGQPESAHAISAAIVEMARGRTTALSFAWLEAAARGEAAIRWHRFLAALLEADCAALEESAASILATGHTSGRAALRGFVQTLLEPSA